MIDAHLMHEQSLQPEMFLAEVIAPGGGIGMEVDVPARRHDNVARLKEPPASAPDLHAI